MAYILYKSLVEALMYIFHKKVLELGWNYESAVIFNIHSMQCLLII